MTKGQINILLSEGFVEYSKGRCYHFNNKIWVVTDILSYPKNNVYFSVDPPYYSGFNPVEFIFDSVEKINALKTLLL